MSLTRPLAPEKNKQEAWCLQLSGALTCVMNVFLEGQDCTL